MDVLVGVQVERASGVRVPVSDADDTRRQVRRRPCTLLFGTGTPSTPSADIYTGHSLAQN